MKKHLALIVAGYFFVVVHYNHATGVGAPPCEYPIASDQVDPNGCVNPVSIQQSPVFASQNDCENVLRAVFNKTNGTNTSIYPPFTTSSVSCFQGH